MKKSDAKLWFSVILMSIALLWTSSIRAATPDNWKDTGFSINASGMTLSEVLREFGVAYGVRVSIELDSDASMKGKWRAESGSEFLDRLMQAYQFRWFVYNHTLYVVQHNDTTSMRLEVGEDAVQDAKGALIGLGLFDSRFGWGELPEEGIVVVSGPRAYVELARDVLLPEKKKPSAKGREVMIFRLKYASAMDRVITVRDQSETIPGIKTILSNLLGTGGYEKKFDGSDIAVSTKRKSHLPHKGRGEAHETARRDSDNPEYPRREAMESSGTERSSKGKHEREPGPRIEADPSLNAIFIYDDVSKREMYQALIAELDVEPQQIEIEALIVDINRSQLSDMGVEWGVSSGNRNLSINGTRTQSQGVDLPLPGATLLISNAGRFYARLKALEDAGEARVLGKPTVLTLDNVAAVLDLSQTTYLPLIGERVTDLADVTAGTKLRVVPRIVREGANTRVRMEIDIEDGSLGESAGTATNVIRSSISTQAIIEPQQTLMIGGYHSESRSKNRQKVPVLGDVPLVGGLFRSTTESSDNRERLFLITPRLWGKTGVPAPKYSQANKAARRMSTRGAADAVPAPRESNSASAMASVAVPAPRESNSTSTMASVEDRTWSTRRIANAPSLDPLLTSQKSNAAQAIAVGQPFPLATAQEGELRISRKLKCAAPKN